MVIVAKARLLSKREYPSLEPLTAEIIEKASADEESNSDEPLRAWMGNKSAHDVRRLERAIQLLLVDHDQYRSLATRGDFGSMSGIAAFFYLALFRTVRTFLKRFVPSNPTWIRTPHNSQVRLKPQTDTIFEAFRLHVSSMVNNSHSETPDAQEFSEIKVDWASSDCLPLEDRSINFCLASPPYCTRIDYAVATKPELAVLGYTTSSFKELRNRLLGTSTVPRVAPKEDNNWGPTCSGFLKALKSHESKASATYYYKNHVQYFEGMFKSLSELHRVMKKNGSCVIVVQDSYYKDLKNDLPQIVTEMASANMLGLTQRVDFSHLRTMAALNPSARHYRETFTAIESVLVFTAV
ncbi:MAG TPA: hypothetical protein VIX17_02245 [Pyrinomonadaceae bacterium]